MHDKISVEFPPGAGGHFLSQVLQCCLDNTPWSNRSINFHGQSYSISKDHWLAPNHNIISVDSPLARYNFWIYYFQKKVVAELGYYRAHGRRWNRSLSPATNARDDAFWLLNQSRFIIQYQTQQKWKLDWIQMLNQPEISWQTIQNFLDSNKQFNHWHLNQWILAVDNYRNTLPKKIAINPNQIRWQIWATALLQEQGIIPDFDLFENFGSYQFRHWLSLHHDYLITQTNRCVHYLG